MRPSSRHVCLVVLEALPDTTLTLAVWYCVWYTLWAHTMAL